MGGQTNNERLWIGVHTSSCGSGILFEDVEHIKFVDMCYGWSLWQYGLWSFQTGGTKLERFLPKNQHTQRK